MRNVSFLVPLLALLVFSWLLSPEAYASLLRVPYDYPTIREACQAAQAGDSVTVYPGYYYHEHASIPPGVAVIGMGANPEQVQIFPWAESADVFYVLTGQEPVLIENLTAYEGNMRVIRNLNPQLTIRRCRLIQTDGWNIISTRADFEMRECWIEFYASECCDWVTCVEPVNVLVEDCVFVGIPWYGTAAPAGSSLEFRNNTFTGWVILGVPIGESRDFSLFFVNNIMIRGASCGAFNPYTMEWRYNDFVDPDHWPWCGYQIGNFSEDPLFCDPDEEDYRLDPDSPCIGAGEDGEDVGARLGVCWPQDVEDALPSVMGGLRVSGPWPNPTTTGVSLAVAGAHAGVMRAEIFDAAGTYIQSLPASSGSDSSILYRWNGRIADGRLAPSGIYYLRINREAEKISKRVIVLR